MITISNGILTAIINPKGAELTSLQGKNGIEYMWEGNPDYWGKHSPVLFPIVGTLKNNRYNYKGNSYELPRHGFARDNDFKVTHAEKHSVTFTLSGNIETLKVYPFDFELHLTYMLSENEITIKYTIVNIGADVMPFSIGAHPAFALPGNFEDYSLVFEHDETLLSTPLENNLLSDEIIPIELVNRSLPLSYSLFQNDALVFKTLTSKYVDIVKNNKALLRVAYKDFPSLGIWTKPGAPFICIEPWQGYADSTAANGDINTKEGIKRLKALKEYTTAFTIEIL